VGCKGRKFLVASIELGVWLFFSVIACIGTVVSINYYAKTLLHPVIIIALMNISACFFGLFFFLGRWFDLSTLFLYGLIAVIFTLVFSTWLFREIFGPRRNYEVLHVFQIIFGTAAIVITWKNPPILSGDHILFPWEEQVAMIGCLVSFIIPAIDYVIFSLREIKVQNLARKLSIFPLTLLIGIIFTFIFYILTIIHIIPLYMIILPIVVVFTSYNLIIWWMPSILFVAPQEPILFEIVNRSGVPLFSLQLSNVNIQPYVRGAVTAIDSIFSTYVDTQASLQIIQFSNLVCYVEIQDVFFTVYIDKFFSSYMQKKLRAFNAEISPVVRNILKEWDGDMRKFAEIGLLFRKRFEFLPVFMKVKEK
jgi:hypothetical protein